MILKSFRCSIDLTIWLLIFVARLFQRLTTVHLSILWVIDLLLYHYEMFLCVVSWAAWAVWLKASVLKSLVNPQLIPDKPSVKSLTMIWISRGPNIDPWGTLLVSRTISDLLTLLCTNFCRIERYYPMRRKRFPSMFIYSTFPIRFQCKILSKSLKNSRCNIDTASFLLPLRERQTLVLKKISCRRTGRFN